MTTVVLLHWMELNILHNSYDKRLLCILLPHFRFLFRSLFSHFIAPPASSLLSSGFFWRLSSSLHFTAWSSYFLGSFTWYCPCFVLWFLHRHYFSLALIWLLFGKSFLFSSPYHCAFQHPLPAQLGSGSGSSRWKTGIRHTYPYRVPLMWRSRCLSHPCCVLVSICVYPGQLAQKENKNKSQAL